MPLLADLARKRALWLETHYDRTLIIHVLRLKESVQSELLQTSNFVHLGL